MWEPEPDDRMGSLTILPLSVWELGPLLNLELVILARLVWLVSNPSDIPVPTAALGLQAYTAREAFF